jgi:hypothetical protein
MRILSFSLFLFTLYKCGMDMWRAGCYTKLSMANVLLHRVLAL